MIQDARHIAAGGNGSIIGRNALQRPSEQVMAMLDQLVSIYQGEAPSLRPPSSSTGRS